MKNSNYEKCKKIRCKNKNLKRDGRKLLGAGDNDGFWRGDGRRILEVRETAAI